MYSYNAAIYRVLSNDETHDRVQLSLHFMMVVIAANFFKLAIMLTVFMSDRSKCIVTTGDAVSSFLSEPDPSTEGKCLLEDDEMLGLIGPSAGSSVGTRHNRKAEPMAETVWQKRTLTYFTLIRKKQSRLIIPLYVFVRIESLALICNSIFLLTAVMFGFISGSKNGGWKWGFNRTQDSTEQSGRYRRLSSSPDLPTFPKSF